MATKTSRKRTYPWSDRLDGQDIRFELMTSDDEARVLRFAQNLPTDDIVFLRMDIRKPDVVGDWVENVGSGRTTTVLAVDADTDEIVGYCSLHKNEKLWTRHIGELRVFVIQALRGIGLASRLVTEMFQVARGQELERVVVNIRRDQPHVQKMLTALGFKAEALLTDWLMDSDGRLHDLLIMSAHLNEDV